MARRVQSRAILRRHNLPLCVQLNPILNERRTSVDDSGRKGEVKRRGEVAEDDSARMDARPARAFCLLSGSISGVN